MIFISNSNRGRFLKTFHSLFVTFQFFPIKNWLSSKRYTDRNISKHSTEIPHVKKYDVWGNLGNIFFDIPLSLIPGENIQVIEMNLQQ